MTTDSLSAKASQDPNWAREELILICAALLKRNWQPIRLTDPLAAELSELIKRLPIHPLEARTDRFRSTSSIQRKSFDLISQRTGYAGVRTKGGKLDNIVLTEFEQNPALMLSIAEALRNLSDAELAKLPSQISVEDFEDERHEGRVLLARHQYYERSRKLRLSRIRAAQLTEAGLACEACDLDFERAYGPLGKGYIQVHHVVPLHQSGPVRTKLADLALLCANCHAMAHRIEPWPTVEQLRDLRRTSRFTENFT